MGSQKGKIFALEAEDFDFFRWRYVCQVAGGRICPVTSGTRRQMMKRPTREQVAETTTVGRCLSSKKEIRAWGVHRRRNSRSPVLIIKTNFKTNKNSDFIN